MLTSAKTPSSVMYNTGDFGVMNLDGTLSHLGRVDDQVKIKVRVFAETFFYSKLNVFDMIAGL